MNKTIILFFIFIWMINSSNFLSQNKKEQLKTLQLELDSLIFVSKINQESKERSLDSLHKIITLKNEDFRTKKNMVESLNSKQKKTLDSINKINTEIETLSILNDSIDKVIKDLRDKSKDIFQMVKIHNQIWSSTNVTRITFNNGDSIQNAQTMEDWKHCGENGIPAYCIVLNKDGSSDFLYNWHVVKDKRGILPSNFRIPTNQDIIEMEKSVGALLAPSLKTSGKWGNSKAINDYSFGANPNFIREENGVFTPNIFGIWTSSEVSESAAIGFTLDDNVDYPHRNDFSKAQGFLIRAIK